MKVSSQSNYNPSFNAKILSQWSCHTKKNKPRNISIVELEKSDLGFARELVQYVEKRRTYDFLEHEILSNTSKTVFEVLNSDLPSLDKTKMYIAMHDNIACGILVANIPKKDPQNDTLVYSSRHNLGRDETEIDWLVTWSPRGKDKFNGIGKALVGEYFRTVKEDSFRDVFVRSEVPEKSYAQSFYERLGFESLGKKRLKLSNKNSAKTIVKDFGSESNDETIPMIITRTKLEEKAAELAKDMKRIEFKDNIIDAEEVINIYL